jgi:cytochrome c553
MSVARRISGMLGLAAVVALFAAPAAAHAQDYDLNFTLPTAGKSGCMVCHGDPNLGRLQGDRFVSYWVDGSVLDQSAHVSVMCTGCHLDFAYKAPHNIDEADWVATAKLACKNCHQEQWDAYSAGVHSIALEPGDQPATEDQDKPLCGDCHGSHDIKPLTDNPEGRAELHARGLEMCGTCHEEYAESYADYYHGAAYRQGAPDAPACWQCHSYHDIRPSDDRDSTVNEDNLIETCGQCHDAVDTGYVQYAGLIHKRIQAYAENPVYGFIQSARESLMEFFGTVRSWFT